jgi:hypothetical protein
LSLGRKLENNLVSDETLASSIKQSIWQRGKRKNKERGPKSKPHEQKPKRVTKGQRNKLFSGALASHKKHIKEGK